MTISPSTGGREPWRVQPIGPDSFSDFAAVLYEGFLDTRSRHSAGDRLRAFVDFDRTLAAFDGADLVGTALVRPLHMTLPGGPRHVAGVSAVAVAPTHRRRGVLSALMDRQFAGLRERGEPVAALWASEGAIYGRFGYGLAARAAAVRLDTARGGLLRAERPRDPGLRLRLGEPQSLRPALEEVHRAVVGRRVGDFARDTRWWEYLLGDPEGERGGFGPLKCALAEDAAGPAGYALYRVRGGYDDFGVPDGAARVQEVTARTPAAHALLWQHVMERDLVATVYAGEQPLDSALFGLLSDGAQARSTLRNNLWIRLVDLAAALELRSYAADVDVVMEVSDRWCPWNAGRWRLTAEQGAARCTPSGATPDLRSEITALGSAYLGLPLGRSLACGDLVELREGAASTLAAAFAHPGEPFCGVLF